MGAVPRMTPLVVRLLAVAGAVLLAAGCGAPPEPLPTGPPPTFGEPGTAPPGSGYPSAGVPTYSPPGGLPTGAGYPTYPLPTYPAAPTFAPPPTTHGPDPAPKCTKGPTAAQVLALIKDKPGIPPNQNYEVKEGPFCAGTWQFTAIGVVGKTLDEVDPLLVVTSGKPASLTLVEAGADVCSDRVESGAPPGIRVRACGS
jgi:hypothetical protein